LPSSGPQPEAISNVPLIGSPLTFRTDATESEINSAGAQLLESYGSFAVARGFDGTLSILRSHGRYAEPFARASELQFAAGAVDVRIVVLPGESPETIEAWLGHAGIAADTGRGTGPVLRGVFGTGDFRWVLARIPASLVSALANQPAVEFIDPVQPVHPWNAE